MSSKTSSKTLGWAEKLKATLKEKAMINYDNNKVTEKKREEKEDQTPKKRVAKTPTKDEKNDNDNGEPSKEAKATKEKKKNTPVNDKSTTVKIPEGNATPAKADKEKAIIKQEKNHQNGGAIAKEEDRQSNPVKVEIIKKNNKENTLKKKVLNQALESNEMFDKLFGAHQGEAEQEKDINKNKKIDSADKKNKINIIKNDKNNTLKDKEDESEAAPAIGQFDVNVNNNLTDETQKQEQQQQRHEQSRQLTVPIKESTQSANHQDLSPLLSHDTRQNSKLDPTFARNDINEALRLLKEQGILSPGGSLSSSLLLHVCILINMIFSC